MYNKALPPAKENSKAEVQRWNDACDNFSASLFEPPSNDVSQRFSPEVLSNDVAVHFSDAVTLTPAST